MLFFYFKENVFFSFITDSSFSVDIDKVYLPVDLTQKGAATALADLVGSSSETNDHDDSTISALHRIELFDSMWQITTKSSNGVLFGYLPQEQWPLLQQIKEATASILYQQYHGMPLAVRGTFTDLNDMKAKKKLVEAEHANVLKEREDRRVKLQHDIVLLKQNMAAKGSNIHY
ncbi:MAG TPA: hypothetical protein VGD33_06785 [Chitinophagaceae bacterium]